MNAPGVSTATAHIQYQLNEQHIYGSSRLGMHKPDTVVCSYYTGYYYNGFNDTWQPMLFAPQCAPPTPTAGYEKLSRLRGKRFYELTNHLGNVLATVTDRKLPKDITANQQVDYFEADIASANDFYPFGMMQVGRSYSLSDYRYGFNGKESDNEWSGNGNMYDYGFRIYNPRLGHFLSVDPLAKSFPFYTPYQFSANMPIAAVDLDGLEAVIKINSAWYQNEIEKAVNDGDVQRATYLASKSIGDPAKNEYAKEAYGDDYAGTFNYSEQNPEELTLYIIELHERIKILEEENTAFKKNN